MDVSFNVVGEVQVVEIGGAINDQAMAAIKFKLNEKVSHGRKLILIELGRFDLQNTVNFNQAVALIQFAVNLGANTAVCGVPPATWGPLYEKARCRFELTRSQPEGVDFLRKAATGGGPATGGKDRPKPRTEEEIKSNELEALLKKYEIYQHIEDYDPFRLEFWLSQYSTSPSPEAMNAERKSTEAFHITVEEIKLLDQECEILGQNIKQLIVQRKKAFSSGELKGKEVTLKAEITAEKSAVDALQKEITDYSMLGQSATHKAHRYQKAMEDQIAELEFKVTKGLEDNATLEKDLAAIDAREEQELQLKKQAHK